MRQGLIASSGVASYGARAPRLPSLNVFLFSLRLHKRVTAACCLIADNYRFIVTSHCAGLTESNCHDVDYMSFMLMFIALFNLFRHISVCHVKFFSCVISCPLAPNPGDATALAVIAI
jgi:hypothetical protein